MITGTLSRYFGLRFLNSVVGSFIGVVALAAMIDYVELMRRGADWPMQRRGSSPRSPSFASPSSPSASCRLLYWWARCRATSRSLGA